MKTERLDEGLFRTVSENGVTIISESIPGVRSAGIGIWIKAASAHEAPIKMGVSHMLEHMVFKGTARRSAREIALELEVRGGTLDAYTARDHTCFQARVLDEDLPRAVDVLTDIVREPALRQDDLDLERRVILEEINTVEDTPDDIVFDMHSRALWPDHSYGFNILGTRDTVGELHADDVRELHQKAYHPGHVVIASAGNLDHEVLLKLLTKAGWMTFEPGPPITEVAPVPAAGRGTIRVERDSAQVHIVVGTDTFPYTDHRRYPLMVVNSVLGSGMSSRLFQRVREELGLAYSVYSYHSFYRHTGVTGVYVGTRPENAEDALAVIMEELAKISADGLTAEELAGAKQQIKGQITLSLESTTARMYRLAGSALYGEPYTCIDDVLKRIDAVDSDAVMEIGSEFFAPDRQTTVWLGPN